MTLFVGKFPFWAPDGLGSRASAVGLDRATLPGATRSLALQVLVMSSAVFPPPPQSTQPGNTSYLNTKC